MSKKILHIITGLNDGGAEGVLTRMCLAEPQNHQVISLMDMGKYGYILQDADVSVYCLNLNTKFISIKKIIELYGIIKKNRPNIVQTWMYHADLIGGIVAKIARVPNIFWGIRHGNLSKGTVKKSTYIIMKICAILSYYLPKKIISCSRNAIISHTNEGYCSSKFVLIQNGYDLKKFRPNKGKKYNFEFSYINKPIIAMVARFDVQKDHFNLINALSILKEKKIKFHLVLVGTGMTEENQVLSKMIEESFLDLFNDITLLGRYDDIPSLMNEIDLHVLSSLGEAFPNVLAEAMACGVPCISTNVGDAKEIVSSHGWIVPAQNPEELSLAIETALEEFSSDLPKWQNRKDSCVLHIQENFEIHSMIDKFHKAWGA
ncbi:glycosyltransferase [Acinetobacter harbinensis]|uniref:glycosyltransferase n=1 Tax=Acinetobacter harbinensis TaxID=1353941 RepID=UPI0028E69B41|nr:glycosyltransferase [Acinetobacter harbinensis]